MNVITVFKDELFAYKLRTLDCPKDGSTKEHVSLFK